MDLRTITIGLPFNFTEPIDELKVKIQKFIDDIKVEYGNIESSIRTIRINLSPIKTEYYKDNKEEIIQRISLVSELCNLLGIRWFNVPFDISRTDRLSSKLLTELAFEILNLFPKTFINLIVASDNGINEDGIKKASKMIKNVSKLDNSGYNNFRVGVSCNVKENTPFFPFTYGPEKLGFSIGLELPREFIRIIENGNTSDLDKIRNNLLDNITPRVKEIEEIATKASKKDQIIFNGIDVSLAPYPEENGSVARLVELLGLEQQGSNGTLFLTSYLTDILKMIIKKGKIKEVGFGGVMYSLLEDEFMGKRNNNNIYSIDSLISYSAVCGCGLDMVPLPGDVFDEEISSIILDVAALSTVLKKALGVRVLPIPMKQENEFTIFNMDFLFNTRIKKIKNVVFNNKIDNFSYLNLKEVKK